MNICIFEGNVVYGHHGFLNARYVYDPIDNVEMLVADVIERDSDTITRQILSLEWFYQFKDEMIKYYPDKYNGVNWKRFKSYIESTVTHG